MATTRKTTRKTATSKSAAARTAKTNASAAKSRSAAAPRSSRQRAAGLLSLRTFNLVAAVLLLAQAIVIIVLHNSQRASRPVTANFLTADQLQSQAAGHPVYAQGSHLLFDLNVTYLVAASLILCAIAYTLLATLRRRQYATDVAARRTSLGWLRFGLAGGMMLVAIGLLNGITDAALLTVLLVLTLAKMLLVQLEERAYGVFSLKKAGAVLTVLISFLPWLVLAMYFKDSLLYGDRFPKYLIWLNLSAFLAFLLLVGNFWLARRQKGRWANYEFAERLCLALGVVAVSAVSWQIFASALR